MTARLWYCECVTMTGRWSPETRPEQPQTRVMGGHLREWKASGLGHRIRNICPVPDDLVDLSPMDLRQILAPEGSLISVTATRGGAA